MHDLPILVLVMATSNQISITTPGGVTGESWWLNMTRPALLDRNVIRPDPLSGT
jgi:hypothetical protein